jgi:hypothetical protein
MARPTISFAATAPGAASADRRSARVLAVASRVVFRFDAGPVRSDVLAIQRAYDPAYDNQRRLTRSLAVTSPGPVPRRPTRTPSGIRKEGRRLAPSPSAVAPASRFS